VSLISVPNFQTLERSLEATLLDHNYRYVSEVLSYIEVINMSYKLTTIDCNRKSPRVVVLGFCAETEQNSECFHTMHLAGVKS
jgi:uncharacterized protein YfbU (UPF0304 family)